MSRSHAELRRLPDGSAELVDLGSNNGTFVNGVPIQRVLVSEGDLIGVGGHLFRIDAGALEEYVERGAVEFSAEALSVIVPDGRPSCETSPSASDRRRCWRSSGHPGPARPPSSTR